MRGKALLPFLVGKIHRGADQFLVRTCRFLTARAADKRSDDRFQVLKHIDLRRCLPLAAFVVEAIASRLQFSGLHASVPTLRDNRRPRVEELPANPAQVKAPLVAGRPSQKRGRHTQPPYTAVFADANAVSVKSHGNTPVGVTGVHKILGEIKILAYNTCKDIVGFLVGGVCSPVRKRQQLFLGNRIGQQRRIVSLYDQLVAATVKCDMGLKPVAHQYVAHFRLQVHRSGVCIGSYCHSLML